jgi:hypothetical protein
MTYRAVGIPELVELLQMPQSRDRTVATAGDLAAVLEEAANMKWRTGQRDGDMARETPPR